MDELSLPHETQVKHTTPDITSGQEPPSSTRVPLVAGPAPIAVALAEHPTAGTVAQ